SSSEEITGMLRVWSEGQREVSDAFLPLVYEEPDRPAHRYLRRERKNHSLQTTAPINEDYLKRITRKNARLESRTHFFAIAANSMREISVDCARMRDGLKRDWTAAKIRLHRELMK